MIPFKLYEGDYVEVPGEGGESSRMCKSLSLKRTISTEATFCLEVDESVWGVCQSLKGEATLMSTRGRAIECLRGGLLITYLYPWSIDITDDCHQALEGLTISQSNFHPTIDITDYIAIGGSLA